MLPQNLPHEPAVTLALALDHGLTQEEYGWVVDRLGRTPTFTELGIYSVMWSEHCSYKNSIAVIKTLPREGEALLVGAGEENAGLVDVGDGLAVAFKIESHNHPSAVEPYQGAATGVGGIQRDIFTMGARPICSLNSLRFGSLENPRVRYLLDGVVRGIGDYGNAFGVPTVAGEVYFDASYEGNPLVNAMSVGVVRVGETASATAEGVGNPVYIVGSATGRDGIHGATFASEELSEESEAKRPSVQVGDPFTEKLLLEATLEAIRSGAVVGIQDMGAAGITCSSCEMSAKGQSGMVLHLERVPVRESGMTPYEILLSESQERMLVVVERGREHEVEAVFEKWDLHAAHVGEVTDDGRVRVLWGDVLVADVPAEHLVLGGGAPVYLRETRRPAYLDETAAFDPASVPDVEDAGEALERLLGSPNIASKRWVYEQYDTHVRTGTVVGPGPSDAAVVRLKGTGLDGRGEKGLAVKTDCNGRYVYLNPRKGGQIAVAEAARNVVCAGGRPLAVTNCLNFGNPYKPEVYWVFKESVGGMGDACRAFGTPVTGGNVSFYNESPEGAVFPTPTIGMVGLVESLDHVTTAAFVTPGDVLLLVSPQGWWHTGGIEG
ncbi:MAG: phosphoribosylformylglycinamidine synthase subunit PurL, partial [Rubricoccaceae bacterium]|nr:phosphoribosylformylglycinamidine synthase subunit PurL [Rubricoccaceae bacterium]